jgi:hypothetical protein
MLKFHILVKMVLNTVKPVLRDHLWDKDMVVLLDRKIQVRSSFDHILPM